MPDEPITLEVEIFRAGDFGDKGKYTPATLRQMADDYNANTHEAPVTLDHAQTGPAYGWVASVRAKGKKMFATIKDITGDLENLIGSKMFKKRSVEIYPEFEATGRPYLKAVSFLGAAAPQIKGMKDPEFIEGLPALCFAEGDHESFEFDEHEEEQVPGWFKKFLASVKGEENPDASDAGEQATPPDESAAQEEGNTMPEWGELTRDQLREHRPDLLDAERSEAFGEGQAEEKQRAGAVFAAGRKYLVGKDGELGKDAQKRVGDAITEGFSGDKASISFADAKIGKWQEGQPDVGANDDPENHAPDESKMDFDEACKTRSKSKGISYRDAFAEISKERGGLE